jgi:hypothetical protein
MIGHVARATLAAMALIATAARPAAAEWQLKPFLGLTFGGTTTFVDLDDAAGHPHVVYGGSVTWLGEIVGVELEFGHTPGFFEAGQVQLVKRSSTTTLTGNVVIALPRRIAQYGLRPYFVGGAGMIRAHIGDALDAFPIADNLVGVNLGGGATGFLTSRVGLNWDVRHFATVGGNTGVRGVSLGPEQLSFWRASMALAFRY